MSASQRPPPSRAGSKPDFLLLWAGLCLLSSWQLDTGVRTIIGLLSNAGLGRLTESEIDSLALGNDKRTLGQLIKLLKKQIPIPDTFTSRLSDALDARNRLIHHVWLQKDGDIRSPDGEAKLVAELKRLHRRMDLGDKSIKQVFRALVTVAGGIPDQVEQEILRGDMKPRTRH